MEGGLTGGREKNHLTGGSMEFRKCKKRLCFLTLALILGFAGQVVAASLVWDPNTDIVDGYKVYYGTSSTSPATSIDVGNTTQHPIDALPLTERTEYFFSVSAYNSAGESPRCAPVAYTAPDTTPPVPPFKLTVK